MYINEHNLGDYILPESSRNRICVVIYEILQINIKFFLEKNYYYEPITLLFNNLKEKFNYDEHIIGFNQAVYFCHNEKISIYEHKCGEIGS